MKNNENLISSFKFQQFFPRELFIIAIFRHIWRVLGGRVIWRADAVNEFRTFSWIIWRRPSAAGQREKAGRRRF